MRLIGFVLLYMLSLSSAFAACEGRLISEWISGGPVCVPQAPARIVVLEPWLSFGTLHELEAQIIGIPMMGIQDQTLREAAEKAAITDVGHPYQPSIERIVALQPDLIIGASYAHEQAYDKLSAIAPTLLLDQLGWKKHYMFLAEIIGRKEAAQRKLDEYETRVTDIRERIPQDLTVSVLRIAPLGFQVYLDGPSAYAPYAVLREAGVRRTDYETATGNTVLKRPDWEEVSALEGDILLYVVVSGLDPALDDDLAAQTQANPLWKTMRAVKADRAHRIDRATWMGFYGTTSAHQVLDDIERYILTEP